ncbi:MAG TPA: GDP-L-fucose synthase [Candidatus Brocadiia bacterium]|nr:GDP-L-fucose synthase [Candidatus Brocadiia bacterium]
MRPADRVAVFGADTLVGAAIVRELQRLGLSPGLVPSAGLAQPGAAEAAFDRLRPDYVFLAAGESGGIEANRARPADLMLDNIYACCNVIRAALARPLKKLLYLASSCSYPRDCPQPMKEEYLFTGPLEPTNEAYATAKLAALVLCQACRAQHGSPFITAIPANPYGPGDDFDPQNAHVIPALIRRMDQAKRSRQPRVTIWGSGAPQREFIYAGDLASACLHVMDHYDSPQPINLGGGQTVSIAQLAAQIREVVDYPGELEFDRSKPDGMPVKALDAARLLALGWRPRVSLRQGLEQTYAWYLDAGRPDVAPPQRP